MNFRVKMGVFLGVVCAWLGALWLVGGTGPRNLGNGDR
jgi:hypothetical protein